MVKNFLSINKILIVKFTVEVMALKCSDGQKLTLKKLTFS